MADGQAKGRRGAANADVPITCGSTTCCPARDISAACSEQLRRHGLTFSAIVIGAFISCIGIGCAARVGSGWGMACAATAIAGGLLTTPQSRPVRLLVFLIAGAALLSLIGSQDKCTRIADAFASLLAWRFLRLLSRTWLHMSVPQVAICTFWLGALLVLLWSDCGAERSAVGIALKNTCCGMSLPFMLIGLCVLACTLSASLLGATNWDRS